MTKELVEMIARTQKVDFLLIEESISRGEFPTVFLKAPYMPDSFIKEVEKRRPVTVDIKYVHNKGFVHWAAWKLRTLNGGN